MWHRFPTFAKEVKDPKLHFAMREADFGRGMGFKRLGIHHVSLGPKSRSSRPHCESLEEEIFFGLQGTPTLWVDGELWRLKPNDVVAFAPGTGRSRGLTNSTQDTVQLFVVGERSKENNRYFYPLDRGAAKDACKAWWGDCPSRLRGSSLGIPGVTLSNCTRTLQCSRPASSSFQDPNP